MMHTTTMNMPPVGMEVNRTAMFTRIRHWSTATRITPTCTTATFTRTEASLQ
jgi:hypothetical protein